MARESCFCGWAGELEDRDLVYAGAGEWGLGCPMCGHLDRLEAWSDAARACILAEAERRRESIWRAFSEPPEPDARSLAVRLQTDDF